MHNLLQNKGYTCLLHSRFYCRHAMLLPIREGGALGDDTTTAVSAAVSQTRGTHNNQILQIALKSLLSLFKKSLS